MALETALSIALEKVFGFAVRHIILSVTACSQGKSDSQIIEEVLLELQRQGHQIGNLNTRLIEVEAQVKYLSGQYSDDFRMNNVEPMQTTKYCANCGILPGCDNGYCHGKTSGVHRWQDGAATVLCAICGRTPGYEGDYCQGKTSGEHRWIEGASTLFCKVCGGVPGKADRYCQGKTSGEHRWIEGASTLFCKVCGGVPGKADRYCQGKTSGEHQWE